MKGDNNNSILQKHWVSKSVKQGIYTHSRGGLSVKAVEGKVFFNGRNWAAMTLREESFRWWTSSNKETIEKISAKRQMSIKICKGRFKTKTKVDVDKR